MSGAGLRRCGGGTTTSSDAAPPALPRSASSLLAAVCAVTISGVYLPQALLSRMAEDLGATVSEIGVAATLAQLGYAVGIVLLVPLIGLVRPRLLLASVMGASMVTLGLAAASPGVGLLAVMFLLVGLASVTPQLLVPLVPLLTDQAGVRRLLAALTAGIGLGIFGSRLVAGTLAQAWGWRAVPWAFAGAVLVLGAACWRVLPSAAPSTRSPYSSTIASMPRVAATRPVLRQSMVMQAGGFFALNAVWTTAGVHLVALGWSELEATGLGAAGVVAAGLTPLGGSLLSRVTPLRLLVAALGMTCVGACAVALSAWSPVAVVAGVFVMTLGALWAQVAHQVRFFAENPTDRASANIAFMAAAFTGGALGALCATAVYDAGGMSGVAMLAAGAVLAALGLRRVVGPRATADAT
ncbi:MFS transporter [Motilibacter aurantiacus]|uniref:MFS transporter n=1 Tax=Motilibacter aurantiacus TaxID=2714955 RepID=UPI001409D7A1|nr:MFS transporter [Motilibacter aurantiacus]NHC47635.1 MFS transporter [Motilibacter aurantiacus]